MANFIKTQNSFNRGEVAPEFWARDDIDGLSRLENMDVTSGGGLTRRRGLMRITELNSAARLVAFSVDEDENYLLALAPNHIWVYHNGVRYQDIPSPWSASDVQKLQYAQRFGTMIFVHPNHQPRVLKKSGTTFSLSAFEFSRNDSDMTENAPFMKFDDASDIKITVTTNSAGNNYATLTTSRDFWTASYVGVRLTLLGKQWLITSFVNSTTVVAYTNGTYSLPTTAVSDWRESAFSGPRGWPVSITFHQDRLVFGGSPGHPSGVWMSCVGRHHDFNVGTGLDDEAIFLTLLSQQRQQICTVVSSDNLQIMTNVGEWAISSKPLTPSVVDIKQHTWVGSVTARYLPPQKIEGATIFISASLRDIRELSLDELGENYNATDLCSLAKHLITTPVDIAYNAATHQLFVVMANGDMAVLNQNSALGISAWGMYKTQGEFKSVAVMDNETYVVVTRGTATYLERFDDAAMTDSGQYGFSWTAAALPLRASGHNGRMIRIRKIAARVLDTKSIYINQMRVTLPNSVYADDAPGYSGDVSVNQLGVSRECINAPWTIQGSDALPTTVLSITMYGYYLV